jgi:hypothetical protein
MDAWDVPIGRGAIRLKRGRLIGARTGPHEGGVAVLASESTDDGKTWRALGPIVTDPDPRTDLGDGALAERRDGTLVYAYRQNRTRGAFAEKPSYAIRVAVSRDGGRRWETLATVAEHGVPAGGPSRGLWAPCPFETPDGRLVCLYDDENTPLLAGFPGHQWLTMRTYSAGTRTFDDPVTVSRAHDPAHLSRDGMASVVALDKNRWRVALESVDVRPPHPNVCRMVASDDGGRTWSWQRREREIVYAPKTFPYMALAPWLVRAADGRLHCAFATDEDRATPDRSGTPPHRLNLDIKAVTSRDGGATWDPTARLLYAGGHRNYLPGLVALAPGRRLVLALDFARDRFVATWDEDPKA